MNGFRPRAISKTLLGHACELRLYKDLTGERWDPDDTANGQEDEPPAVALVRGRAYHQAVAAVHRVWARPGGLLNLERLPELYADAWFKSGGGPIGPPDPLGLEWLLEYSSENPWFGDGGDRRLQDAEITLRVPSSLAASTMPSRDWVARVDAIALAAVDDEFETATSQFLEAWEFSTAVSLDVQQLELQSYCVQTVLARSPQIPVRLRGLEIRVMVGKLRPPYWALDATLSAEQFAEVGGRISERLRRVLAGAWSVDPSLATCRPCPYHRLNCAESLYREPAALMEGTIG